MKSEKRNFAKNFIKGTLVAGALLSVSALSATPNSSNLFDYNTMGSGAEVRSELLHTVSAGLDIFEAKFGGKEEGKAEGKKAETKEAKAKEAKCGEGKCGEGKCGGKEEGKAEGKAKEAKCGEGKCGS
jgi:uncharacterized low-complexity protein